MTVITRFAPSPTGYLHVGGARTALFNWLYARHHGGKYLLRIEDTDRARSTQENVDVIVQGLDWLGLMPDEAPIFQFARADRHAQVARDLVHQGKAYYCYCTPAELEERRAQAMKEGRPPKYDGRCRHRNDKPHNQPVIRLASPTEGETIIEDLVQGVVTVQNQQLDDMILLRSDGTPTYMLSVVVDDHDMHITHIIRGDDHLNNAFRQYHLYRACDWTAPKFAHISLIHGPDGAKLSKRHGATSVDEYAKMGYLPEAMRNYLVRLGWAHGDDEIISDAQAQEWFTLEAVGRSPSRFDYAKLGSLNGHYIKEASDERLVELMMPHLQEFISHELTLKERDRLLKGMPGLKQRAKTLVELAESAVFYVHSLPLPTDEAARALLSPASITLLKEFGALSASLKEGHTHALEELARQFTQEKGIKLGDLAQPLRVALTGRKVSPGIFEVMEVLGPQECLARINAC